MAFDSACGVFSDRSTIVNHPLVFDGEIQQPVKDSRKRSVVPETKTVAALKSHSEAERRRRERINAHLDTLRSLVPNNGKMDKAALLAEVVSQVKRLKMAAAQASEGLHIPTDSDAVEVAVVENNVGDGNGEVLLEARLCCEYRPELLADIRRAMDGLPARVLKCEISSLGGRMKTVFLVACDGSAAARECAAGSVRQVFGDVLDKVSASAEYDRLVFPRKRQRLSLPFDS
ncbi:transcription factor bHLH30-like isoform X2 [Andrographis paniculata]|nr:transcription factor bHLH30-like isoform X2 [Andrographis paniculata]